MTATTVHRWDTTTAPSLSLICAACGQRLTETTEGEFRILFYTPCPGPPPPSP